MATEHAPAEYTQALEDIDRLADLEGGWNSYRAPSIDALARDRAKFWLRRFWQQPYPKVPAPIVGPTSGGGVCLRWDVSGLEIEIRVEPTGDSYNVARIDSAEPLREGSLDELVNPLKEIINPYVAGH